MVATGHILRFQESLIELKIPGNVRSTRTSVKRQLHVFKRQLREKPENTTTFLLSEILRCSVPCWQTIGTSGRGPARVQTHHRHHLLHPSPRPQRLTSPRTGCCSHQDLSTFKESQQDDPGDPWLQARDNVTVKPGLTCLEPPAICASSSTRAAHQRGHRSSAFPLTWHHFCHLVFGGVGKTPSSAAGTALVLQAFRAPLGTSNAGALTALRGGGTGKPVSRHGTGG